MAQTNQERVNRAMTLLREGLAPFVEREMEAVYKDDWTDHAPRAEWKDGAMQWDVANLLSTMWENWQDVFRNTLGHAERSLTSELREWRNKWAHQNVFSTDDAYRCMDSVERLLKAIAAPEAIEVEKQKFELLRVRFEEQARKETRRATTSTVEGQPSAGLRCWRDIVTPHPDVASGRYQQAEFAADLGQVFRGEGSDEYRDPVEFYRRTYLTEGLKMLLVGALKRLGGNGGDPVVELQTNFGGGKTHSMLALFHLFGGRGAGELAGIEPVLQEAGIAQPPCARRAVLVGTDLSPAHTHPMPDGVEARTLWGVMAWQLLGREGYELVRGADEAGVSPGSNALRDLFTRAAPCLILIDEWIAFVRQLYGKDGLAAGSFDANLTFAQSLTEAAKAVPGALVVASIPSSDIEVGGEGGKEALTRLKNTFARLESAWRPASAEEGFEIVRRRLFQPVTDPQLFKARDAVVRAFSEMYRQNAQEFPLGVGEADYERRMRDAYPIHPELFERLYQDWGSLDKFQRTRGVLRLMAAVIYDLWDKNDASLMILPATVPVSANPVQYELTRYMDDPWIPVIEKDVDGPHALPNQIDRDNPNLKRFSACLRVARTLYLGSAPTLHTSHRGIEDKRIRLGCVQPGESVAIFGDALRRLTDQATHLYVDGRRYWYSTQPSVTRMALERAEQYKERVDDVYEELKKRIREELRNATMRGDFQAVYVAPAAPGDVPDEMSTRLVILGPDQPHSRGAENSAARKHAALLLSQKGTGLRNYANTLVFLAPDQTRLDELLDGTRLYLAWASIRNEQDGLELTTFQRTQVKTKFDDADETVKRRISETFQWLLVPEQPDPGDSRIVWQETRLQSVDGLAVRASKKLRQDGILAVQYAGASLRHELDKVLWKNADHIGIRQLLDYFAKYLYLPRLRDGKVLLDAIQEGVGLITWQHDTFAYADRYDEATGRYHGLRAGQIITLSPDGSGVLVKPDIAARQMEADKPKPAPMNTEPVSSTYRPTATSGGSTVRESGTTGTLGLDETEPASAAPCLPRRFHGSVTLDPMRLSRDAGTISQEVIQHLLALMGARARITLEIEVDVPDGVPESVSRIVTENCRTLKFASSEFEEE